MPRGGAYRNLSQMGTATFFLTAPFKPAVHVAGDFNGWDPRATPMRHCGQGLFTVTVPITRRTRYEFVVTMDSSGQQVWVADPYAREIAWDAQGPKAVLADDTPFVWHDDAWRRPPLADLVIYELCVRDFAGRRPPRTTAHVADPALFGRFAGVEARLDYLQTLGVNAIELMPISEFPGDSSWGYNPIFYMAPKWVYGRPSELKALVDAAHHRGIAIILDMVLNHAWGDHPYYRMYPPLFSPDGAPQQNLNPFFHRHNNGHANAWGGLDWDHHSPHTLAYMEDIVRFWLEEYHLDGFRFDWLGGVEYDPWQPYRESFDPFYGIAPIARAAREATPDCYLIGEYWPIHGTSPAKTAARLVAETDIDAVWNGAFHHALENCLFQTWQWECQDVTDAFAGFHRQGFSRGDQVVNYVVCHDERRPEFELEHYAGHVQLGGAEAMIQPITRREIGLRKARLGLALLLTMPGIPMLYAGQEFGADNPRTIDFSPLDWSQLMHPAGHAQFEYHQRLLRLRADHPALRADGLEWYCDDFAQSKLLRYKRWDGTGDVAVVALNFDNIGQTVGLGFPFDGLWQEAISGEMVEVRGNWRDFTLPAWSAVILVPAH
jgi:1,4-alpha-glucan branching enzyme